MNKTKTKALILFVSLLMVSTLTACASKVKPADMSGYEGFKSEHHFKTSRISDILSDIEKKKTGIYLIASPNNPTSESYVQILEDFATEKGINIFYINTDDTSYDETIRTRVQTLESESIPDTDFRNQYPIIYVASKNNLHAIYPVFNRVSVSSRYLNLEEQTTTSEQLQSRWYE